MQENAYDQYDPADDEPSRFSRIKSAASTAIGALVAMALLLTLGIWFYRLGVRDAQNVPIIRAAVTPAKTRPEDPGGLVAPHQDVSSYGVADSEGVQASAAVIAPAAPEPEEEDIAMGDLKPVTESPIAPARPTRANSTPTTEETLDTVSTEDLLREAEVLAAAARAAAQGEAAGAARAAAAEEAAPAAKPETEAESALGEKLELALASETTTDPTAEDIPATETEATELAPGELGKVFAGAEPMAPSISPVALRRPADLRKRVAAATEVEAASADNLAVAAKQSRIQIQLAADPSEATIRDMWQRIQRANSDILRDRTLAVQTTVSGGTTFYRLRVGPFNDGATARAVCQALKARGQDCLVARNS